MCVCKCVPVCLSVCVCACVPACVGVFVCTYARVCMCSVCIIYVSVPFSQTESQQVALMCLLFFMHLPVLIPRHSISSPIYIQQGLLMVMKFLLLRCHVCGRLQGNANRVQYLCLKLFFKNMITLKPVKRSIKPVEDFDPRPPEFRGTASSRLPDLLQKVKGEQLCVSLLLDSSCCQWENSTIPAQTSSPSLPDTASLLDTVAGFKSSLKITEDQARHIEQNTREQHNSLLWHSVRRYRITASLFGSVLSRKPNTPPDSLVLRIIQPKLFSTRATAYGIEKEQTAISEYIAYQRSRGHPDIAVSPSGFLVSTTHPFLGASPDGAVFDPSNTLQPFGFLEVKCPYSARMLTPTDACATSGFCCTADPITGQLKLKENHAYYSQVQGQMAIGQRPWCDFVIYTSKGLSVQRIEYNEKFWEDLFHKLSNFYDNCVAPEIVSPVHSLGLPMRNLSKK